jgi:hypothetical protein
LTSQPFATSPSQSAYPPEHASVQIPSAQVGVACTVLQGRLQPPQLLTSVSVDVSQPLEARASQSPYPVWHDPMPQAPFVHAAVAFSGAQGLLQPPQ